MDDRLALEHLIARLKSVVHGGKASGAMAFREGRFGDAQAAAKQAEDAQKYLATLQDLQKKWARITLAPGQATPRRSRIPSSKKLKGSEYRIPILQALQQMGGRGSLREVLAIVEPIVKDRLTSEDLSMLSDGRTLRWRNSAQWERNAMVKEGLLLANSPHGVWEISDKGVSLLNSNGSDDLPF